MNVQRYAFLLLRHLWLIVLIVALAAAGTWIRVGKQPSIYASRAVLEVEVEESKVVNIQDIKQTNVRGLDALNTVVQSLTSNDLMLDVARKIKRPEEWAGKNSAGQIDAAQESALAASVRGQLTVSLRRNTRLIDIVAEDTDKAKAQQIANQVVASFKDAQENDRAGELTDAGRFLKTQAEELKKKLEKSEKALADYRQQNQAVSVNERQNIIVERLTSLNSQVTEANTKSAGIAADLAVLEKVNPDNIEQMLKLQSVASLPQVASLRTAVNSKEAEFAALKERYLELHPKYIAAVSELDDLRRKLKTAILDAGVTLRQQYQTFADTEKNLKEMLADQEKKALELDSVAIPYRALEGEVAADRKLYQDVLSRLKETGVTSAQKEKSPFREVETALINPIPVRPNRTKTLLTGILLALAASIGLVLLIDYLDSSIRAVDEAESELGLPVLAAVPEIDLSKLPRGGSVITDAPGSSTAEAFRSLRASISLLGDAAHRRILMMTSAVPAEGKTFNSINLAASLTGQGYRVLLIDADLRRPSLTSTLLEPDDRKGEEYRGLTDVLSGLVKFEATVRTTAIENLFLLPAGRRAPNPAELLSQPVFPELLKTLSGYFDRIVVDSAPINAVSDTLALAAHVDAVCLVVRCGKTPRRVIQRALKLLQTAGARMAGVVMNRMPSKFGAAYYYYYYGDPYVKDSVYGAVATDEKPKGKKKRRRTTTASPAAPVSGREVLD